MAKELQTHCAGCGKKFPTFHWNSDVVLGGCGYHRVRTGKEPVTRHPYEPFCTLRCALSYARAAWEQALEKGKANSKQSKGKS